MYLIEDDIYNTNLGFCLGDREKFNDHLTNIGVPEEMLADGLGKYIICNNHHLLWMEQLKTLEDFSILIHELLHHCMGVFAERGIPIREDNDEVMCYYQAMMFRNICKKLKIKGFSYERPKVSTKTKK